MNSLVHQLPFTLFDGPLYSLALARRAGAPIRDIQDALSALLAEGVVVQQRDGWTLTDHGHRAVANDLEVLT